MNLADGEMLADYRYIIERFRKVEKLLTFESVQRLVALRGFTSA